LARVIALVTFKIIKPTTQLRTQTHECINHGGGGRENMLLGWKVGAIAKKVEQVFIAQVLRGYRLRN